LKDLRKYGAAPFDVAVIHGGPGAIGEMAPVARELALLFGVLAGIPAGIILFLVDKKYVDFGHNDIRFWIKTIIVWVSSLTSDC